MQSDLGTATDRDWERFHKFHLFYIQQRGMDAIILWCSMGLSLGGRIVTGSCIESQAISVSLTGH